MRLAYSVSFAVQQLWRQGSPEVFYFVSAIAKLIVSVAWWSVKGRSGSLKILLVGDKWILAVLGFVLTFCLSSCLDCENHVFVALQIWVFKIRLVAPASKKKVKLQEIGSVSSVRFNNGSFNDMYQLVFGWVSVVIIVVSTIPTSNYLQFLTNWAAVTVISKKTAWKFLIFFVCNLFHHRKSSRWAWGISCFWLSFFVGECWNVSGILHYGNCEKQWTKFLGWEIWNGCLKVGFIFFDYQMEKIFNFG